ncbi:MAG: cysteine dioxygenase [Rikenella sp.]|nr:cysteine dioxygenase [Rikenella sp.]
MQTSLLSKATLAEQSSLISNAIEKYDDFFERLLSIVRNRPINEALGEQIKTYVLDWLTEHPLADDFAQYSPSSYIRTYLGRSTEIHWEAILMSWQSGNTTAIHAHPQFAGYHFADGVFKVEIFEPVNDNRARLTETLIIDKPTGLFAVGPAGRFDNHIHRITCLSETGHSLHVYSDDALQGTVYEQI